MSPLDPNGSPVAPRNRPWQPDDTVGDGRDSRHRARRGGAAPEPFASDNGYGDHPYPESFADPYGPSGDAVPGSAPGGADGAVADADPAPPAEPAPDDPAPMPPNGRSHVGRRRAGRRPPTDDSATGRAGRNLPAAIGVGVGLVVLVLGPLFLKRPSFVGVIAVAVTIGIWEMGRAVRSAQARPPMVPLFAGAWLMTGMAWFAGTDGLGLGVLVTLLAVLVWRLGEGPAGYLRDVTAATLIAVYVPFLLGFAVLLAEPDDGHYRVLVALAAVVLSDTGGYAFGVKWGKRPMAPTISPKKSWEGFAGSVFTTAVGSAVLLWALLDVSWWKGALFGAALAVAAVLGDLTESMIKRDLKIKDMSELLPGHGGLMDRLDSILFAVPIAFVLLSLLAPTT